MLKWLLSGLMSSGVGDRFDGGTGGDLASLTKAMRTEMDKKGDHRLAGHARRQNTGDVDSPLALSYKPR